MDDDGKIIPEMLSRERVQAFEKEKKDMDKKLRDTLPKLHYNNGVGDELYFFIQQLKKPESAEKDVGCRMNWPLVAYFFPKGSLLGLSGDLALKSKVATLS